MRRYKMFLLNSTGALLKNVKAGGVAKIRHLKTEPALRKGEKKAKGEEMDRHSISEPDLVSGKKDKKAALARPNHFVAIPVVNGKIREKLLEVQKALLGSNKKFEKCLVPVEKTHITLAVMHLKGQQQIDKATESLRSAIVRMQNEGISEMKLNFEGLGNFRNQVLFARILEDDGFAKLCLAAEIVRKSFLEAGVSITDSRDFNAHLTVAKLSRDPKLRYRGIKKIDGTWYREFESASFGQEDCSKLQLLSMLKTDKTTGYYHCLSEAMFGNTSSNVVPSKSEFNSEVM